MDIIKLLKSIINFNEFVVATQAVVTDRPSLKIQLNFPTVLALKNIQSFEVEYFNKYYESGLAFKIFELILEVPCSNPWSAVGNELVCLIQYWLDAVRKHLITHNNYWWNFLSILLNFIQNIYTKHSVIVKCLVEKTGDCLLDLATGSEPSAEQRFNIVQTFNMYCASANRQYRLAMKHKFDTYLVRLSSIMANSGDVRLQYCIMETLIRWLWPRQELEVREASAALWFPLTLYTRQTIKVFLERPWQNFWRDTRNFLNAHNERNDSVVSVICRKLSFGTVEILSGPREYWLDFNYETKCISLMLEPSLFNMFGVSKHQFVVCAALVIKEENTISVQLHREPRQLYISLKVVDPLQIFPSKLLENNYDVHVVISSSRSDFRLVDKALRTIFDQKYQVIVRNEDNAEAHQRYDSSQTLDCITEDDSRFSIPPVVLHQKQSARQSDQRTSSARQSSSSSVSSLVTLREKLSARPEYIFNKELGKVSVRPQLKSVSEVSEREEKQSYCSPISTGKLEPYVCPSKNINKEDKISQSESYYPQKPKLQNQDAENIIDLLAEEALQYTEETRKSQIQKSEVVNNIPNVFKSANSRKCNRSFIKESTDESCSAFVENTPAVNLEVKENTNILATVTSKKRACKNISLKRKKLRSENNESVLIRPIINSNKNLAKENNGNIKKLSTWLSPLTNIESKFNFNYIEVVECLEAIVVKICEDLDKNFSQNRKKNINKVLSNIGVQNPFEKVTDYIEEMNKKTQNKINSKAKVKEIKLKFSNSKKQMETQISKRKIKNDVKIMPIVESDDIENESTNKDNFNLSRKISVDLVNRNKRKRKLYSRKDDDILKAEIGIHNSETEEDNIVLSQLKTINTTPKFFLSKTKDVNNAFDDLLTTIEGEKNIKKVDIKLGKGAIEYNFTSGSEDDFKTRGNKVYKSTKKSILVRKTVSGNKKNDSKYSYCPVNTTKNIKRKNVRGQKGKKLSPARSRDVVDERMRKAPNDALNTSLIIESGIDEIGVESEPIHKKPRMMSISDEKECEIFTISDNVTKKQKRKRNVRSKNKKNLTNNELVTLDIAEDREVSPLPGLVIETAQTITQPDDSDTGRIIEKIKDIYRSDQLPDVSDVPHTRCNSKKNSCTLCKNETSQRTSTESDTNRSGNNQLVIVLDKFDLHSASLSTVGKSPITAHGISNEMPPAVKELDKEISPRSLDIQDLSYNAINYYNLLNNDMNEILNNFNSEDTAESQYEVGRSQILKTDKGQEENLDKMHDNHNSMSRESPESLKVNLSPTVSITRLSPNVIDKFLAPSKAVINSNQNPNNNVTRRQTRSYLRLNTNPNNNKDNEMSIEPSPQNVRVSTISPINLDRELNFNRENKSINQSTADHDSTPRKLDCLNAESSKTANFERHSINQIETSEINSSSGGGLSSIKDWLLDNNRREIADEDTNVDIFKDILSNFLEKLNTTLHETNNNTRQSFVRMLLDHQTRLDQLLNDIEDRYKETVNDSIVTLANVIAEKITDIKTWSRERAANHLSETIEATRNILRDDFRQKQNLESLLKEDIQNVIDLIGNRNKNA